MISIEDDKLKSCEPITQEEFDRQQEESNRQKEIEAEIEALKAKFKKD
ncbi:hypothetical protein ACFLVO_02995 [Chloroflexota bacterium]